MPCADHPPLGSAVSPIIIEVLTQGVSHGRVLLGFVLVGP
jgi:hypothetical protein